MKSLLFVITVFSIGRFIDTHKGDDLYSNKVKEQKDHDQNEEQLHYEESEEQPDPGENEEQIDYEQYYDKTDSGENKEQPDNEQNEEQPDSEKNKEPDPEENEEEPDSKEKERAKKYQEALKIFHSEAKIGDTADLIGHNQHVQQSKFYKDLGRRLQDSEITAVKNDDHLTFEKAPPELVLLVAKESALLRTGRDTDLQSEFDRKKLLRTGDYWNGVWKEEVKPKSVMRSASQEKKLGSIKARINPGTEFYKVVSQMKKISPQLLYIINKKQL